MGRKMSGVEPFLILSVLRILYFPFHGTRLFCGWPILVPPGAMRLRGACGAFGFTLF